MRLKHPLITSFLLCVYLLGSFCATSVYAAEAAAAAEKSEVKDHKALGQKVSDQKNSDQKTEEQKKPTAAVEKADDAAADVANESAKPEKILPPDVRVIIDVSGSMKHTDPQNLRKPAVDLIVRLLPDKSRAGLWTFGNSVNMLMPLRNVDAKWREEAAPKTQQINSIAMFTNIGKALDEVSFDRKNLNPNFKTHIILLTDGVVDIGSDLAANAKEKQRIISDILPKLHEAGYVIHTIALSPEADVELLKKLSYTTDGVFTTAVSADQLMPVFLKIFEQAVPAERVPLENNGFLVDASIKEFTALIFRKEGVKQTIVVAPDGQEFSSTSPKDNLNWYHTDLYDLITAESPKAGQWKIKTEISPQSRITVVSDLQLVVGKLRNNIRTNDELDVSYLFQENGSTLTNKDFLKIIEANALVAKIGAEENFQISLTSIEPPADGIYHSKISTFTEPGDYEINVVVDGKTFKREFKHNLSVRDSLLSFEKSKEMTADGVPTYSYKIKLDPQIADLTSVKMTASIKNSMNNNQFKILPLESDNTWQLSFSPSKAGDYTVDFRAQGNLLDGNKLEESLHADSFHYAPTVAVEAKSSAASAPVAVEKPKEEPAKDELAKLPLYLGMGIGTLLVIILSYLGYKVILGGKNKTELDEIEKALNEDPKPVASKAKAAKSVAGVETAMEMPSSESTESSMEELFPLDSLEDSSEKKE